MGVKETLEKSTAKVVGAEFSSEQITTPYFRPAYHEIPESKSDRVDVMSQMKANLSQLEDLHGRLAFMMNEVRGLIRKD